MTPEELLRKQNSAILSALEHLADALSHVVPEDNRLAQMELGHANGEIERLRNLVVKGTDE